MVRRYGNYFKMGKELMGRLKRIRVMYPQVDRRIFSGTERRAQIPIQVQAFKLNEDGFRENA
jgi:hypothetical protein